MPASEPLAPPKEVLEGTNYSFAMVMLPLTVPMSTVADPAPIFPVNRLRFCSEMVTGKSQETLPLTE
jgi:hypothetical protein